MGRFKDGYEIDSLAKQNYKIKSKGYLHLKFADNCSQIKIWAIGATRPTKVSNLTLVRTRNRHSELLEFL